MQPDDRAQIASAAVGVGAEFNAGEQGSDIVCDWRVDAADSQDLRDWFHRVTKTFLRPVHHVVAIESIVLSDV